MPPMPAAEIDRFLKAPHHAIMATNRRDGAPQISPVWYLYEAGNFYILMNEGTAKHRNVQRDPRLSLCIDAGHPDARAVMVYGQAKLLPQSEPLAQEMHWRIIRHYHADEDSARQYAESSREWPWLLAVVRPEKIISQDFN